MGLISPPPPPVSLVGGSHVYIAAPPTRSIPEPDAHVVRTGVQTDEVRVASRAKTKPVVLLQHAVAEYRRAIAGMPDCPPGCQVRFAQHARRGLPAHATLRARPSQLTRVPAIRGKTPAAGGASATFLVPTASVE